MNDAIQSLLQIVTEQLRNNPDLEDAQLFAKVETALNRDPGLQTAVAQTPMTQTLSDEARAYQTSVAGGTVYVGSQGVDTDKLAAVFETVLKKLTGPGQASSVPQNLPRSGVVKFVGRTERLRALHQQVKQSERIQITSIVGMGGLGKTELALQYAIAQYAAGSYPGGVCWLRAKDEDIATQITRFAQINLRLSLPEGDIVELVRYCYQHWPVGDVLLVIDDVSDFEAIKPFLPPSDQRFKLLMTTRLEIKRGVNRFTITVLDEANALSLLASLAGERRVQAEQNEAVQLCQWVGYLPLGLRLLGQYLADETDLSMWALLEELEEVGLAATALKGITNERGVLQTLELSWQALNEDEQALACLLGMFALAPIPLSLVGKCLPDVTEKSLRATHRGLIQRSLLTRTGSGLYQLHQIVQEFFRVKLRQHDESTAIKVSFCDALVEIAQGIKYGQTLAQSLAVRESIVHLEELSTCWVDSLSDANLARPFLGIGYFYHSQGLYEFALPWSQACLEQTTNRLGKSHVDVALSLNNLATLYRAQGKYEAAEPLLKDALAMDQALLGEAHPYVATSLNNLAELYRAQGKYEAAEPLLKDALAMDQALLGEAHPYVATSLNNLANLYRAQGKYEAAEPLLKDALAMRQALLGEAHPSVATSLNDLAGLYRDQGKYEAAELLLKDALAMYQALLGEAHPYVATSLNNLAGLYRDQGKYEAAEPLLKDALAMYQALLGEAHPYVAISLWNLGILYQKKGDILQAEVLYVKALAIAKNSLGLEHPTTQGIQSWLDSL